MNKSDKVIEEQRIKTGIESRQFRNGCDSRGNVIKQNLIKRFKFHVCKFKKLLLILA